MMKPDYEVKLLMAPSAVLDTDRKLTSAVRSAFDIPSVVLKMNVQFLDTDSKDIYGNGWCPRVRKTEGEPDFELTYKKRYPVTDGDPMKYSALNRELHRLRRGGQYPS